MGYEGWSLEMDLLSTDEWYRWEDFVHFVRYRLGQLSFTHDRRLIRQQLDLPRSLRQIYQPFRQDSRFPNGAMLINTSFEIELCIRRILSAVDIPDIENYSNCTPDVLNIYNKAKELYYCHLNELFQLSNYSELMLAEKGVFSRATFEDRNSLKWREVPAIHVQPASKPTMPKPSSMTMLSKLKIDSEPKYASTTNTDSIGFEY